MADTFNRRFVYILTLLIYLNIFVYMNSLHFISTNTNIIFLGILFVYIIYNFILKERQLKLPFPLLIWIIIYFIITSIYFLLDGTDSKSLEYYKIIINSLFFMLSYIIILYNSGEESIEIARKAILHATLISTLLLIIDFLVPGLFIKDNSGFYIAGRASALFLNSNIAGTVLLLGLIFSIDLIKKSNRIYFLSFIFIGIIVTFSRSSILLFFIIMLMFLFQGKMSIRSFFISTLFIVFFITSLLTFMFEYLQQHDISVSNIQQRIEFIETLGEGGENESTRMRLLVLNKALELYENNPIFGEGFAATNLWNIRISTHNQYLKDFAEYGLLAFLMFPLLLFISTYRMRKSDKTIGRIFIIFLLIKAFFTHNILNSYFYLYSFVLIYLISSFKLNNQRKPKL